MSNKKDFATSTVLTAPSTPTAGTSLVVQSGHGARFPAAPFYVTAHPPSDMPTLDNAEKLLVTAKSTDTFTITRAQGDTTAKTIEPGWRISNAVFLADFPATFDDLADGTTNKGYTSTEKTKLAGVETGAQATSNTNLATAGNAATAKTTPVDADTMPIIDSTATTVQKKVTWANIKATLKTYFDTLYQPLDATLTALAGLATGANKIPYSTGTDTFGQLDLDTSGTLSSNSDTKIPSQKAVKTYVDGKAPSANSANVFTDQGTTSTSYTDLATVVSCAVTVGASGILLVNWAGGAYNTANIMKMSVALSGANTVAANDNWSTDSRSASYLYGQTGSNIFTGLTPGSTTVTMKFKTSAGTANFFNKSLNAISF